MLGSLKDISISKKEYFLTTLLIAISGVNYFLGNTYLAISCFIVFLFFFDKQKIRYKIVGGYLLVVAIAFAGSALWYSRFDVTSYVSMFVRIITAFMIVDTLRHKFVHAYVDVMFKISIVGLFFWSLFVLFPSIEHSFLANITPIFDFYLYETNEGISSHLEGQRPAPHFIIYTMNHGNSGFLSEQMDYLSDLNGMNRIFMRNSLCFTEPSVAMLFVIPALFFNLVLTKQLISKTSIVFILAIFTSLSTGGLTVLFLVLGGWILVQNDFKSKVFSVPVISVIAVFAFYNIEQFGTEILDKVNELQQANLAKASRTRFVSGYLDFKEALHHPVFGKGFKRDDTWNYFDDHRNNGTTYILTKYGFIIFFLYFGLMYRFFKQLCIKHQVSWKYAFVMLLAILLVGFGNKNFEKPFFIGLSMMFLVLKYRTKPMGLHKA